MLSQKAWNAEITENTYGVGQSRNQKSREGGAADLDWVQKELDLQPWHVEQPWQAPAFRCSALDRAGLRPWGCLGPHPSHLWGWCCCRGDPLCGFRGAGDLSNALVYSLSSPRPRNQPSLGEPLLYVSLVPLLSMPSCKPWDSLPNPGSQKFFPRTLYL